MLFCLAKLKPHALKHLIEGAVALCGVCRVPVPVPQSMRVLSSVTHVPCEETTALCLVELRGYLQV